MTEQPPYQRWILDVSSGIAPALNLFLAPRIGAAAQLPEREAAQARLTLLLSMAIHATLMVSAPLWWLVARVPAVALASVGCAALLLGTGPLIRSSGRPEPGARWLLACCYLLEAFAVLLTGGVDSPFLIFLAVPPLYAALIHNVRTAVILGWLSLPVILGLWWLDPLLPAGVPVATWAFNLVAAFPFALLVASVASTSTLLEAQATQKLAASRDEERIQRQRAEEASAARGRFFSNVSHELRTPLNAIVGSVELLSRDLPEYGLQREHLLRLKDSSDELLGLIDELLELRETQGRPDEPVEDLPSLNVLVVDDLATNRVIARHMLQALGASVTEASSGEEALAEIRRCRPDMVLLDRHMPGVDGLEVARRVRLEDGQLTLVALTASALDEDRAACFAAGMDAFLPKPLRMDVLRKLLGQVGRGPL